MRISKKNTITENDALKLAWCANESHEIEAVFNITPFDELLTNEERQLISISEHKENEIRLEGIRRLLIYFFNEAENALDVTKKLYVLCYTVAPDLLGKFGSLDSIAKQFDQTRQCFSKKLINQNKKLNLRSRNQKSDSAVEVYREIATANHAERIAEEKKEAKRVYMAEYRMRKAAEIKAYQVQYRAKYKERLNRVRRERRAAKRKKP